MENNEEVRNALAVLQKYGMFNDNQTSVAKTEPSRTDSFDIQPFKEPAKQDNIEDIVSSLNLTQRQRENVEAILVGSGTALTRKWLGKHIGTSLASGVGAVLSDIIINRAQGRR